SNNLRFTLDNRQRWTLSYHGPGAPVPVVVDAELALHVAGRVVPLQALEGATVERLIGPDHGVLVVSGTTAGIAVAVTFADAADPDPAAITVMVSPDRVQAVVQGIRYGGMPVANVLPGSGSLQALLNGYHSRSECRLIQKVEEEGVHVSHAALGLARQDRGLARAFSPREP